MKDQIKKLIFYDLAYLVLSIKITTKCAQAIEKGIKLCKMIFYDLAKNR